MTGRIVIRNIVGSLEIGVPIINLEARVGIFFWRMPTRFWLPKNLASGMIEGIGPVSARKLVQAFGPDVFDVIEQQPARFQDVPGIGPHRAQRIVRGWAEQRVIREIMLFLHSHRVGTAQAVRIFKTYGADAVQLISETPYPLARGPSGNAGGGMSARSASFPAHAIAGKLGIAKASIMRARAGAATR